MKRIVTRDGKVSFILDKVVKTLANGEILARVLNDEVDVFVDGKWIKMKSRYIHLEKDRTDI